MEISEGLLKHVRAEKVHNNKRKQIGPRARKGSSGAMISYLCGDGGRTPPEIKNIIKAKCYLLNDFNFLPLILLIYKREKIFSLLYLLNDRTGPRLSVHENGPLTVSVPIQSGPLTYSVLDQMKKIKSVFS